MTEEPEAVLSLFRLSMTEDEIAKLAAEFDSAEDVGNIPEI